MLPLIVLGADETVADAVRGHLPSEMFRLFDDTESAIHRLNAEFALEVEASDDSWTGTAGIALHLDLGWIANVAYGPHLLGAATIGKPVKLRHTGWTLVLDHHLETHDPSRPRRVVDDMAEGVDYSTIVWQAAIALKAHFVVNLTQPQSGPGQSPLGAVIHHVNVRVEP